MEPAERRFNTEDISKQLLRLMHPLHVDSLSLHDPAGELLWCNEGAFGPDEQAVVLDAMDVFALDSGREDLKLTLDKDRTAMFCCARDAAREVRGIAVAIVETPPGRDQGAKLGGPSVTLQMRRFAHLLAPAGEAQVVSTPARGSDANALLEVVAKPAAQIALQITPPVERRARAPSGQGMRIHARRYARLRAGGAARRYEVKLAPNASFSADLALGILVIENIRRTGERYTQTTTSFTVPLSVESVTQGGWIDRLLPILTRAALAPGMIGFSLPTGAWVDELQAAEQFIADCERAKCFVTLDNFTLGSNGFNLLRSPAVKCLKIEPTLIGAVVHDRFAHAKLAAIIQAARVLGLYCVAKQVSSQSEATWLAGAGIEFADGVSRGVAVAASRSDEVAASTSENQVTF